MFVFLSKSFEIVNRNKATFGVTTNMCETEINGPLYATISFNFFYSEFIKKKSNKELFISSTFKFHLNYEACYSISIRQKSPNTYKETKSNVNFMPSIYKSWCSSFIAIHWIVWKTNFHIDDLYAFISIQHHCSAQNIYITVTTLCFGFVFLLCRTEYVCVVVCTIH